MKKILLLALFLQCTHLLLAQKTPVRLNHIAVYVTDLAKSDKFYIHIIGLDTIANPFRDGKHTWFKIGDHSQLHLIQGLGEPTKPNKNSHLCFTVPSIETVIESLGIAGIPYEDWPGKKNAVTTRVDGVKQIYIQDPDGNWIEINNDTY